MKKILALFILLFSTFSFAASTLECEFGIKRNGSIEAELIKKTKQLARVNTDILIDDAELITDFASLELEIDNLSYKLTVSASSSKFGNSIEARIKDLRTGISNRVQGEDKLHSELTRTDDIGHQAEGVAVVCSLK